MKFIPKSEEPVAFTNWKAQEVDRLEPYYAANNADAVWGHLPSSPPPNPEAGITYYSKKELAAALLEEQGNLCCYCNRLIHQYEPLKNDVEHNDRRTSIEHLEAKEADARSLTFRYDNLAASCIGGERRIPRFSYCNSRRGNKPIAVRPTDEACEKLVFYSLDGQILGTTKEIENTLHDVLGLAYFDEARRAEIRAEFYENIAEYNAWEGNEDERPELIPISLDEARLRIEALSTIDKAKGSYNEFCSAIISVLKREVLREL
jgi:uncharacterized protein (TIGR02646 family)